MKRAWIAVTSLILVACGGESHHEPKTPQEWIAEQERLAMEEQQNQDDDFSYSNVETDEEKKQKFDEKQAKMELQRATRNAESCPGVVADQEGDDPPRGELSVAITFEEDGTVSDVSIPSPFDETPVGNCIRRAYAAVVVPPFIGGQQIKHWDLEIKDPEPEEGEQ